MLCKFKIAMFRKIVPLYLSVYYKEDNMIISGFALAVLSISNSHSVVENFREVVVLCNSVTSRFWKMVGINYQMFMIKSFWAWWIRDRYKTLQLPFANYAKLRFSEKIDLRINYNLSFYVIEFNIVHLKMCHV